MSWSEDEHTGGIPVLALCDTTVLLCHRAETNLRHDDRLSHLLPPNPLKAILVG
jgi:hypothetical protein